MKPGGPVEAVSSQKKSQLQHAKMSVVLRGFVRPQTPASVLPGLDAIAATSSEMSASPTHLVAVSHAICFLHSHLLCSRSGACGAASFEAVAVAVAVAVSLALPTRDLSRFSG